MSRREHKATREFRKALDQAARLEAKLCELSLGNYLRQMWPVLEPVTPLVHNWHIDSVAEHLEGCTTGQIKRLVINIPPKSLKSTITSVMWPTWVWGPNKQPGTRWLFASYSHRVSVRDSMNRRTLLKSPLYQRYWGDQVSLASTSSRELLDTQTVFQNSKRGRMEATTMDGEGVGLGGRFLVIDDPHNPSEILSDVERDRTLSNFDQKLFNRLDDKLNGVIVLIMQRLHEKDLSGHLLSDDRLGRWTHLKLPMVAPEATTITYPRTGTIHTRNAGDLLIPLREGQDEINEYRERLGDYGFAGQYQQEPVPLGGGLFKVDYFQRWPIDPDDDPEDDLPIFTQCVQSWDCAFKEKEENSYSVCTTWGCTERGYFLLDVWRKHVEYPELRDAMEELAREYDPEAILIEDKASGQSAIQELKRANLPIIAIKADGDKKSRAVAASSQAAAGKIWIPRGQPWAAAYLQEMCTFPKGKYNDQVDSTSQFINWIRSCDTPLMDYYKSENEKERQREIASGEPIGYQAIPGVPSGYPGSEIYGCAYPGCGKELPPNGPNIIAKRGLKFCCQEHAGW